MIAAAWGCTTTPPDDGAPDTLTESQQTAINEVVVEITELATVLASFSSIVDPQALIEQGSAAFGECPMITSDVTSNSIAVTFDYGDGCTNGVYGDSVVSGVVSASVVISTRSATITFDNFAVDEDSVTGTTTVTVDGSGSSASLSGQVDLQTSGGSVEGSMTFRFNIETGVITIAAADLTITAASGNSYDVVIAALVIDPMDNGNFIPEAGTVTVEVPNDPPIPGTTTLEITFTAQSPVDGSVEIEVVAVNVS